jgi:uncharacterized protein
MRKLSDGRIEAMALAVVKALETRGGVSVTDRGAAVRIVAGQLRGAFQEDSALDRAVRTRIASLSRKVPEGSREWDILYRQYAEEISRRRG